MPSSTVRPGRHLVLLSVLAAWLTGCVTPPRYRGPIGVRNQHPVQLTALRMEPASAQPLDVGAGQAELRLDYSRMFLRSSRAGNAFTMDGEILRAGLKGSVGVIPGWQVSLEIPVAHSSGGFLDDFVNRFHDSISVADGGQGEVADDLFEVRAVQQGNVVYQMERRDLALLDIPLEVQWHAWQWRSPAVNLDLALRGALELPTGDQRAGYGNGGLDFALGVVGELGFGPLALTSHVGRSFVHTPDRAREAGLSYADSTSFGVGLELALTADTAAIAQVEMEQTALRRLIGVHTESDHWLLWVGLRTRLSDALSIELSFGEDLTLNGPPDFTAHLGLRTSFGGHRQ